MVGIPHPKLFFEETRKCKHGLGVPKNNVGQNKNNLNKNELPKNNLKLKIRTPVVHKKKMSRKRYHYRCIIPLS